MKKQTLNTDRENIISHLKSSTQLLESLLGNKDAVHRDSTSRFYYNSFIAPLTVHVGITCPDENTFDTVEQLGAWVDENIKPVIKITIMSKPNFINGDDSRKNLTGTELLNKAKNWKK